MIGRLNKIKIKKKRKRNKNKEKRKRNKKSSLEKEMHIFPFFIDQTIGASLCYHALLPKKDDE